MNKKKTIQDILKVATSNLVVLLSGVVVGFLLPKVIGVVDYGYYKTYTLYATYMGMFHFGIADGIYLKYGGKNYDELEKKKFCFYSQFFILLEATIAIIVLSCSIIFGRGDYGFIFAFLALYLLFHNLTSYYQIISQATSRFSELSMRNIIQSVLIICAVVMIWIVNKFLRVNVTYRTYLLEYTVVIVLLAIWYIYTYRDITFPNKKYEKYVCFKDIIGFIVIGFPLMLANLCSSLILTLDRQFVNLLFDNKTYAVYAFAYNMLALVTTATSAVATVIYPKLKQTNENSLKKVYSSLVGVISRVVFGSLIIYFPLDLFVNWYLPQYSSSLVIFRIIFPGLAVSSAITIVMHNYYKAIGKSSLFFFKSVVTLVISGVANYIAFVMFRTTESISIASIITMLFWYVFVEIFFIKNYRVKWFSNLLYIVIMMMGFYIVTGISNCYLGCLFYMFFYLAILMVFNGKSVMKVLTNKRK